MSQDSIVQGSGDAFTFKVKDTNKSGMVFDAYYLYGFADGWTVYNGGTLLTPVVSDPIIYQISKADAQAGKISAKPPVGFEGTLDSVTFARVQVTQEPVDEASSDAPSTQPAESPEPSDTASDDTIQSGDDGTVDATQPASDETATDEPSASPSDSTAAADQVEVTDISGATVEPGSVDDIVANLAATASTSSDSKWGANWWWLHTKCCCCICKCCCCPLKVTKCTNQLTINKISSPATGSTVDAGQVVTYTVTAKNPSLLLSLTSATITDDLSDVLDNAQLTGTPTATISGRATTAPVINGTTLTWNGSLGKLQTVTITYSVTVNNDVSLGDALVNHVTGFGVNSFKKNIVSNCVTGTEVGCTSTLTATGPAIVGLQVAKTSNPPSGSYVLPGRLVNYTLNATNTGNVTLNNVTLTDNLADVLDNATITGAFSSTIDGVATGGVVLRGTTLTWNGSLAPGSTVVVNYAVTVNEGTTTLDSMKNGVIGDTGTSTPSNCVTGTEEGCYSLLNPPRTPSSLNVSKVSDPASGSQVSPGQTVSYTVTAVNDSDSDLNPVTVTDNLSGVLGAADVVTGSLMAKVDGSPASPAASILGTTVTWSGPLHAHSTVVITYQVVVRPDVTSADVLTNAVTGTGVDPQFPDQPATSTCVTGLEAGCFSTLTVATTGLTINKTSDPASGSVVGPGQSVTYTITANNTGSVSLDPVTVTDDLTSILAFGTLQSSYARGDEMLALPDPTVTNGILKWQGAIAGGQTVTIAYTVVLNQDLAGANLLTNKVIGSGVNPYAPNTPINSNCVDGTEAGCSSTLTVGHPNLEVSKVSDPANGSFYTSGQTITYTLTAANTGNVDLDSVTLTDDLTDVIDNAIFDFAFVTAMIDGAPSPIMPSVSQSATNVTWNGPLAAGSALTLTYQVTASGGSVGDQIINHVVSSATVPYDPSIVVPTTCVTGDEDGCFSILTPYIAQMRVWKTSDQVTGFMHQDDIVTFDVYGMNIGTVDLVTSSVVDHLNNVLPYADVTAGPYVATIDDQPAGAATLDVDAQTLTWTGPLAAGQTVHFTFQVQVKQSVVSSDEMVNRATGSGQDSAVSRSIVPSNCMTGYEDGCFVVLHGADQITDTSTAANPADDSTIVESSDSSEDLTPTTNNDLPGALSDASFRSEGVVDSAVDEVVTPAPNLVVNTVSTPTSGSFVSPSQTVSYTVTASNTGNVDLNQVTVVNDLSDVVDNGSVRPSSLWATMDGQTVHSPVLTQDNNLAWIGDIPAGQTVTMNYQVAVDSDLTAADTLQNTVTGTATDPSDPNEVVLSNCVTGDESGCYSDVTPRVKDLHVGVTSDLPSTDPAQAGDIITYTITGQNAGNVDLYNVHLFNDLTGMIDNGQLSQVPAAGIIDGQSVGEVTVEDDTLIWTGDLPVGKTVTVTYQVVVDSEETAASGLTNRITGNASDSRFARDDAIVNCGETGFEEQDCWTWNGILAYYLNKTSTPYISVRPGQVLTYTVVATNNSSHDTSGLGLPDFPVSPTITDDLSSILPYVDYVGNVTAKMSTFSISSQGYLPAVPADPPVWDGNSTLTWSGTIDAWSALTFTFDVRVKDDTPNGTVLNNTVDSTPVPATTGPYTGFCNPRSLKVTPTGGTVAPGKDGYSDDLPDYDGCTTSIPVAAISLDMSKTSDPASGSTVLPGDQVTYTLTATNTGTTVLNNVTLTDDLSGVLSSATMGTATASINGTATTAPTVTNDKLTWVGTLQGGETVTVTYKVTVNQNVTAADVLKNSVTGSATDPSAPDVTVPVTCKTGEEPQCSTTVIPSVPGLTITKVSDPPTGSAVAPGDTVTYTLRAQNSGNVDLTPVNLTDNLSDVLDNATLDQSSLSATIDGTAVAAPVVGADNKLTWSGAVAAGKSVIVTYKVTVNANLAAADVLKNAVTGTGQIPNSTQPVTSTCVTGQEEGCSSTLGANITKFIVTKTSDPESFVRPGDTVTYTITGVNSGNQDVTPTITDTLTNVLNNATYNQDATAKVDGQTAAAPSLNASGDMLTWNGSVPQGKSVVITYSVTVKDGTASGTKIVNNVATNVEGSCDPSVAKCSTTVTVSNGGLQISKASDPVTGSKVAGGSVVTYTLTAKNTGISQITDVNLTDDLSGVLSHATQLDSPTIAISDGSTAAAPAIANGRLTWTGDLAGGATATVTYKVTVNTNLTLTDTLVNKVTGSGTDPETGEPVDSTCQTGSEPGCSSELGAEIPSLQVSKVSDPVSGTAVAPNQVVTYTLTAKNTGNVNLAAAMVGDDLVGVLNNATLVDGSMTASIDGTSTTAPVMGAVLPTEVSWVGPLNAGQTVTVVYKVKVNADAVAPAILLNKVLAGGSILGGDTPSIFPSNCALGTEAGCFSSLPVGASAFQTTKVSDPTDVIYPGEDITFTVTRTNTGQVAGDTAMSDTLTGAAKLNSASFSATIDGAAQIAPVVAADQMSWTWSGTIPAGKAVVITYTATVNSDAQPGDTVQNCVVTPGSDDQVCSGPTPVPGLKIDKTSVPPTGSTVGAGDTVTYILTATNADPTEEYTDVVLSDNLSDVLAHATLNAESIPVMVGTQQVGTATLSSDNVLSWTGSLAAQATATLTYSVKVDTDVVASTALTNAVTGSAPSPRPDHPGNVDSTCVTGTEPGCFSTVTVGGTTFETTKTADPSDVVRAGDNLTYTVTSHNTGDEAGDPQLFDDMSGILDNAELVGSSLVAKIDGVTQDAPVLAADGQSWTWNGSVPAGKTVVVTYTVTVNTDARPGSTLKNTINSVDCDPDLGPLPERCITPPVLVPGLNIVKTSNPASGSKVVAGDTVTYTLSAKNEHTSQTYADVKLSDDLAGVLAYATLVDDSVTTKINGTTVQSGAAVANDVLSWSGSLAPQATITITYSVKVNDNVESGQVLTNAVTGTAPDPDHSGDNVKSTCVTGTEPGCFSTVTVSGPFFNTEKTVSPTGNVHLGDVLTYTITSKNTGDVAGTPGIDDDMTGVVDDATLDPTSLVAKIGDAVQTAPVLAANGHITWDGTVEPGQTVIITYTVTVKADAEIGAKLENSVTTTSGPCSKTPLPPECTPKPPVVGGLSMDKESSPATGSKVVGGQVVTYTLTATNTEDPDLDNALTYDPVHVTDNLSNVLNNAALDTSSLSASIDGTPATAPSVSDANVLTWDGKLTPGQKVTVTYKVTVNADVENGQVLKNAVTGTAENPENPGTDISSNCKTGVEEGCSSVLTTGGFTTKKTADVSLADPGQVITYTITGTNTSGVTVNKVVVDDMTDAAADADFVQGSATTNIGDTPTVSGTILTWTGAVLDGQTLKITYQMKVHDNALPGAVLINSVAVGNIGEPPPEQPPCTTTPMPPECLTITVPGLTVSKTSVPATGSKVTAGQVISYTLTATNENPEQAYDNVTLSDNLAGVLAYADLNAGPFPVKVNDQQVGTATFANNNVLSWTGTLPPKATATLTYQVTVKQDVATGQVLKNAVTGSAPNPDHPDQKVPSTCVEGSTNPLCSSTLTVGTAAFTFNKTADVSKAYPGDVITYTITGKSSGDVDTPASAKVTDDLSEVLPYATFDSASLTATIDGTAVQTMPVLGSNDQLTWTGSVAVGQVLTITYKMTVKDDVAPGTTLHNVVSSSIVDNCDTNPDLPECTKDVFVPGLQTSKVSDPVSGTSVVAGQTVSYTLTATNLDQDTAYDGVVLSDNLANVLNHATLVPGSLTTKINGTAVQPGATVSAQNVLSWTGSLPAKATIVVTYQAIVNSDVVGGQVLRNGVTSSAPIPGKPDEKVPSTCVEGSTDPKCSSELPIEDTTIKLTKTSSPATFVDPGAEITYTLTGENLSDVAAIKTLTDDLTDVLKNATYVTGSATASINGASQTAPAVAGNTLTWTGTIPAGQTLTITYKMKVNDTAVPGTTLTNGFSVTTPGQPQEPPDCTVTPTPDWCNTVTVDGLKVNKVSNPVSRSDLLLESNSTITYTVTAQNIGDTLYNPVILTDKLPTYTTIVSSSLNATIDGTKVDVPAPTVSNGTLTWNGSLAAGKSVVVTYAVTINSSNVPAGSEIRNAVIGSAKDPNSPDRAIKSTCVTGTEEGCYSLLHTTGSTPAEIGLVKTSSPSGTVHAGDTITYTVTATNSGHTDHNTIVTDHLDQVVNNATFVAGSATAKIGSTTMDAPVYSVLNKTLTWTGYLEVGEVATITYQVKVNDGVPTGTVLRNEVTTDINPECDPTKDPGCSHDVTVNNPGLQITKTSDPQTGSKVYSGQTVTYTLTAVNKGLDDLNVTLSDNLSGVLAYAQMGQGPFTAMIDGQAFGNATVSNRILTWTGVVPAGKTVTLAYSVVMNNDLSTATGTLKNDVTGTGSNPKNPDEDIPSTCVTGDEPGCSSILTPEDIAFLVTKVSNPPSGSIVSPTQTITYTVSGTNTSSGPIAATLTDDLSGVLGNASLVFGSTKATIDGQPASDPVSSSANKTLTWTGTLQPGQKAVMTYTVVVNQTASVDATVKNMVKGSAYNPDKPNEELPTSCTTGTEPGCSTTEVVGNARVQIAKTSDPANGIRVDSGDTVTYTLTAQTSNLPLNPVVLTDNLSDVLDNADLVPDSLSATINGQAQAAPTISAGNVLTWSGPVPANSTVTVSYAVTVKADQPVTSSLYNSVIGGGTDTNNPNTPAKSNCILGTEPGCFSNLPVGPAPSPRLGVTKVSDPATGSVVRAGQVITYTLTGANTGNRDLSMVTLTDNLASVAAHATLVPGSLKATIDGQAVTNPIINSGAVLTWTGPVAVGKSVIVTYQFTVNQDIAVGDTLTNSVTGKATAADTPPGTDVPSTCVDGQTGQPGCSSTLTGGEGNLNITKTSDPASGSTARPGQTISYTLTASNSGNAPIDDVVMSDNLSGVLGAASLVPGSLTVSSAGTAEAPVLMGSSIVWEGSLNAGQTVTVTYQVVVNSTVTVTDKIVNKVTGVGTNPDVNPKNPDKKTPSTCVTGDEPGCSSVITPEISKLNVTKAANVPAATAGQTITYTVTAVNAGTVDLNPVNLSDNLSSVLKYATLVPGSLKATINGAAATAPVVSSNGILTWTGAVAAGQTVVLTYQAIVNTSVTTTATVYNSVTGSGVNPKNPGGPNPSTCVKGTEPGCSVPVIVGPVKIATGGSVSHSWTPMEVLPLMGVMSGLLLAYFTTRKEVTIVKH